MIPFDEIEENIRQREQKLKARELEIRIKELEQELDNVSVQPTTKYDEAASGLKQKRLYKKNTDIGKFCLIVVSVIVAIRLAAWLGTVLMVMGIIWMAYKLFIEPD